MKYAHLCMQLQNIHRSTNSRSSGFQAVLVYWGMNELTLYQNGAQVTKKCKTAFTGKLLNWPKNILSVNDRADMLESQV